MASSSSSSSLLFPSPFFFRNHGLFFSPPSGLRLSICKSESYSLSIGRSREVSNIPRNGGVNSNSASIKAEVFQQREPMVPPYNVLITGSTKGAAPFHLFRLFDVTLCFCFPFESQFPAGSLCVIVRELYRFRYCFMDSGVCCRFISKNCGCVLA